MKKRTLNGLAMALCFFSLTLFVTLFVTACASAGNYTKKQVGGINADRNYPVVLDDFFQDGGEYTAVKGPCVAVQAVWDANQKHWRQQVKGYNGAAEDMATAKVWAAAKSLMPPDRKGRKEFEPFGFSLVYKNGRYDFSKFGGSSEKEAEKTVVSSAAAKETKKNSAAKAEKERSVQEKAALSQEDRQYKIVLDSWIQDGGDHPRFDNPTVAVQAVFDPNQKKWRQQIVLFDDASEDLVTDKVWGAARSIIPPDKAASDWFSYKFTPVYTNGGYDFSKLKNFQKTAVIPNKESELALAAEKAIEEVFPKESGREEKPAGKQPKAKPVEKKPALSKTERLALRICLINSLYKENLQKMGWWADDMDPIGNLKTFQKNYLEVTRFADGIPGPKSKSAIERGLKAREFLHGLGDLDAIPDSCEPKKRLLEIREDDRKNGPLTFADVLFLEKAQKELEASGWRGLADSLNRECVGCNTAAGQKAEAEIKEKKKE